jgi:replicative DNA helicase
MGSGVSWAHEAEKRLLGNLLEHSVETPRVVDLVADRLSVEDFSTIQHRAVYEAVAELLEDGEPISLPHVLRRLETHRTPVPDLGEVLGLVVEHSYPRYSDRSLLGQVTLIRAAARARKTRELGQEITRAANAEDGERALQGAYETMLRLATEQDVDDSEDEGAFIDEAASRLRDAGSEDRALLHTGLPELDGIFPTGVAPRTLTVVAALTSRGKTTLALQVADRLALEIMLRARRGIVRFVSLEMGRVELHRRRLIALTGISMDAWLRRAPLPPGADGKLMDAVRDLKSRPMAIRYAGTMSLGQIRALARKDANTRGLALLVCDYLQLVALGRKTAESRVQEVTAIAYGLKAIAMDHDAPVLAVAQLNRAAEGNATPKLSDLRESGGIEQAADNVLFVYSHPKDEHDVVRLRIGKQRNGPRDLECRAVFDGPRFRFESLEEGTPA